MDGSVVQRTPDRPNSPERKDIAKMTPEELREEVKVTREAWKDLSNDVKKDAEASGFGTWLENLWGQIKEKATGVWEWLSGLFGDKEEEADDAAPVKTISQKDKEKAAKIVENAESPEEALKQLKAETEKQQEKDLKGIEAEGKIEPGESVQIAYWSEDRQEAMTATVSLSSKGIPQFTIANERGGIKYVMDLPVMAKILRVDVSQITKGTLNLEPNIGGPVPVKTDQIFDLFKRMINKRENKITLKTEDNEVDFNQTSNTLTAPVPLSERYKEENSKKKATTEVEKSWFEELKDGAQEWWTSIKEVPEMFNIYQDLAGKIDEIDDLLAEVEKTEDPKIQEKYLGQIDVKLGYITGRLKAVQRDVGQLPNIFGGLLDQLKGQMARIEKLPNYESYFNRFENYFFGPEKTQREVLLSNLNSTINLYDETIDPTPSLYDDLKAVIDEYGTKIEGEAKVKATSMIVERLQTNVVFAELPKSMQQKIGAKLIEFVA